MELNAVITNPPIVTLRVANLPSNASEADIRALFSRYGRVEGVRLFSAEEPGGRSPGFGYIELSADEVEVAVSGLDGEVLDGSTIRVSRISGRPPVPPVAKEDPAGGALPLDDALPSNLLRYRYQVASVEKVEVPDGGQGNDWYCYVLVSGRARITGFHRGTLEEVTAFANNCAEGFNLRNATGKSYSVMAHGRKK